MYIEPQLVLKALHVVAVIAWMAGLFYLPRLFVYHCQAEKGSDKSETFKVMERRLLKVIMNPAMIAAWVFGIWMVVLNPSYFALGWFHVKLLLVLAMTAFHMALGKWRKDFEAECNGRSEKFFRISNEVPTLLMVAIVILAVVKPF